MRGIRSKQDFISLYLVAMHKMGLLVTTTCFKEDLLKMMSIDKYEDLFSFFYNLDDLDFSSELSSFVAKEWITLIPREEGVTIRLSHSFCFPIAEQLAENYDSYYLSLMIQLLRELKLSSDLRHFIPYDVDTLYRLTNPNAIYTIGASTSIVTDGTVDPLDKTDTYLVQDASFVVLQRMKEEKLAAFELFYRFEDQRYIFYIVKKIVNLCREVTDYMKFFQPELIEERKEFEELSHVKGYRYKK